MGDVVNLKRFKKRTERRAVGATGRRQPDAVWPNQIRTRFWTNSAPDRANELLDQHRIDGEDAS